MSEIPYPIRSWKRVYRGIAAAGLLLAGSAGAYDFDDMAGQTVEQDAYGGGDYYLAPDPVYGGLGLLDPGYAFFAYDVYGYPGSGVRDYGGASSYGYPDRGYSGYGYPGYGSGYGPVTRSYSLPAYGEVHNSAATSDRAYIRQLEERIRKLENANKQSLPAYGDRLNSSAWPSSNAAQPVNKAPGAGQFGQPAYPAAASPRGSHSEYPVFQPSYGGPPTYRFRQ